MMHESLVDKVFQQMPRGKAATGDAFEDVLYGSESEIDSEDDDAPAKPAARGQVAPKVKHGARLRVDDDEPMDLLHGAAAGITTKNERKRNGGKGSSKFKTDEDTGRMVIEDSDEDDEVAVGGEAVAGEAYKESMTSVDGFTRGPNGRIKFNKDTKKRRREEAETEDIEMGGVTVPSPGKKAKGKRQEPRLGAEFKAKVRDDSCLISLN
jgi:ribosomal RNA-processing protein 12